MQGRRRARPALGALVAGGVLLLGVLAVVFALVSTRGGQAQLPPSALAPPSPPDAVLSPSSPFAADAMPAHRDLLLTAALMLLAATLMCCGVCIVLNDVNGDVGNRSDVP